ncbi:MAG TPA: RNB domain-containing ribonuclease, partial [Polyangiaceae bacterium]|nr:RNB domain-containing ribonuclease [Polyangiaceae bacterium]
MDPPTGRKQLRSLARRAMLERGLLPDFSPAVLAETLAITKATVESGPSVRDLRGLLWASIDNDDSRDLDQLTVAQPLTNGAVKISVAVADVDATVARGSSIDGHARVNTTSVYTAAQTFPMLPEKLSTDLTSLGEDQERMAIVIDMAVAADGTVTEYEIARAVVRNHAKLAYGSTAAWLEGTAPAPPRVTSVPG